MRRSAAWRLDGASKKDRLDIDSIELVGAAAELAAHLHQPAFRQYPAISAWPRALSIVVTRSREQRQRK